VIPEWKGRTVWVRTLHASERDAYLASLRDVKRDRRGVTIVDRTANGSARLAVLCLCDEQGRRLFADDDAAELGLKSSAALDRITDVAARLNRLNTEALEEAEKNSETTRNGSSTSSSPGQSFTAR
jgi:predicted DNA binding protein